MLAQRLASELKDVYEQLARTPPSVTFVGSAQLAKGDPALLVLEEAAARFDRIAIACSFQKEASVVLDLLLRVRLATVRLRRHGEHRDQVLPELELVLAHGEHFYFLLERVA